jgi:hypothetical protein
MGHRLHHQGMGLDEQMLHTEKPGTSEP